MKREVPLLLTFLFGAFYVLSNFIVWERWKLVAENVNNWAFIVIAFTYVLGVGNVLRIHGLKISRFESGWGYSAATIAGLAVMILFGMVLWFLPVTEGESTFRFRVLEPVVAQEAVHASAPAGSGDQFDVRLGTRLVEDRNGDGSTQPGDELECSLHYSYLGASAVPDAVFVIAYDPKALEPVVGGKAVPAAGQASATPEPPTVAPEPTAPSVADASQAPSSIPAATAALAPAPGPPPPGGIQVLPAGLMWNAGRIVPSWYGQTGAGNGQTSVYNWFYDAIYVPMQSTMFALLAFFISSAAFRAFRLRSVHAVLLGVTALVVILGSVPVGEAVWGNFPSLVAWVMNCLQTAGKRAILIGAALGAIATGMKMIVGAEKGYLGRD